MSTQQAGEDASADVSVQHALIGNVAATSDTFHRTAHPDAQWFPTAGLGLFIHWGISSVLGQYDLSWGMMKREPGHVRKNVERHGLPAVSAGVTPRTYWEQARQFKADRYVPDKWLAAAKSAGMEYAVLTTRHHDGFALWPSAYGEFSTKTYLDGRDLVGEYVAACRRNGLKVGFYYSPPDWYWHRDRMSFGYGNSAPLGIDHEPITLPTPTPEERQQLDDAYSAYVRGQVVELLTRYGTIDILWFDGALPRKEATISVAEIRELQPGILINPRGHGYGDFETPECRFPSAPFAPGVWWELCYVFSDGAWGYLQHECYKPCGWLLAELSGARAWDGNFLPNVGPDSHGELPYAFYQRMAELAAWMAINGEAVRGTRGGIWPERCNVPVTRNNAAWYAHLDWCCDEEVVITEVEAPARLTHLRTGAAIPFTHRERRLSFALPADLKSIQTDIVKIVW